MPQKRSKNRFQDKIKGKWQHFERLVAAIHKAADKGSDVRWDEIINGRQFDVTIRFRKGLYQHLTVVECKDYKQPVPVDRVEAFVTKSRDVHANVAVLASTSGFQSGARECAARHGITLLHVTRGRTIEPAVFGLKWSDPTEVLHIERIGFRYADGSVQELPQESNVLLYYARHVILNRDGNRTSLDDFLNAAIEPDISRDDYADVEIEVAKGTMIESPDDGQIPQKELSAIRVRLAIVEAQSISGPFRVDPAILSHEVQVRNVATDETTSFDSHSLPLGLDNKFVAGKFYEAAGLAFFYYCHSVSEDAAEVWLVESFQHGGLWQAKLVLELKAAEKYIEVTDAKVLERLEERRRKMAV